MKTAEETPLLTQKRDRDRTRAVNLVLIAAGVAAAVIFGLQPLLPGASLVFWFNLMKAIVLALSLNLITGYTGYIDFGHVVFYGLGTYVAGITIGMLGVAVPVPLWVFVGPLIVAAIAVGVGLPALRLRGAYFAIAMLSFNAATRLIILNLPRDFAGGAFGIPTPEIYDPHTAYYAMVGLLVAVAGFTVWLGNSRFGVGLKSIRDDEVAASVMGVRTTRYKLAAFGVSAYVAGVAGSIEYWFVAFTSNELVFANVLTVEMVAGVFLGGAGTTVGPILGAGLLYLIRDMLWVRFPYLYLPMFGVVLVVVVLWMPRGIVGFVEDRVPWLRAKLK